MNDSQINPLESEYQTIQKLTDENAMRFITLMKSSAARIVNKYNSLHDLLSASPGNLTIEQIEVLIQGASTCKWSENSHKGYRMRFPEILLLIQNIKKDRSVLFVDTFRILEIINLYLDFKILNDVVQGIFIFQKGERTVNLLRELLKKIWFTERSITNDRLKQLEYEAAYGKLERDLAEVISRSKPDELSEEVFKKLIAQFTSSVMRTADKLLLPCLLECIVLEGDGPGKSRKKNLIFPLLTVCVSREFETEESIKTSKSYTSFYEYKIRTVESIIGK